MVYRAECEECEWVGEFHEDEQVAEAEADSHEAEHLMAFVG